MMELPKGITVERSLKAAGRIAFIPKRFAVCDYCGWLTRVPIALGVTWTNGKCEHCEGKDEDRLYSWPIADPSWRNNNDPNLDNCMRAMEDAPAVEEAASGI